MRYGTEYREMIDFSTEDPERDPNVSESFNLSCPIFTECLGRRSEDVAGKQV